MDAAPGTSLLLIRHGETESNRDGRIQGHLDVPLSARGLAQARRLAAALLDELPDAIYSSDLSRARVTAEILAAGRVPVVDEPRLREAAFGTFQGLTATEIETRYPGAYRAWRADSLRHRPPGGETVEDLQARCMAALRELLGRHAGQTVAVVAHGGPIRVMVCGLLELPLEAYARLRVENASIARILFRENGVMLASFNDVCHLKAPGACPEHSGWEEK